MSRCSACRGHLLRSPRGLAFESHGFAIAANTSVTPATISNLRAAARGFFDLPAEAKDAWNHGLGYGYGGYLPQGASPPAFPVHGLFYSTLIHCHSACSTPLSQGTLSSPVPIRFFCSTVSLTSLLHGATGNENGAHLFGEFDTPTDLVESLTIRGLVHLTRPAATAAATTTAATVHSAGTGGCSPDATTVHNGGAGDRPAGAAAEHGVGTGDSTGDSTDSDATMVPSLHCSPDGPGAAPALAQDMSDPGVIDPVPTSPAALRPAVGGGGWFFCFFFGGGPLSFCGM